MADHNASRNASDQKPQNGTTPLISNDANNRNASNNDTGNNTSNNTSSNNTSNSKSDNVLLSNGGASSDATEQLLKREQQDAPRKVDNIRLKERQAAECDIVSDDAPTPPLPPDGGYGWIIMLASFMVNVIVDGVCFSFGIFYLEFLDYFGESKAKTSVIGSVLNGMYLTMGPIVSALCNKFGCRSVSIIGSLIATLAYCLSIFSTNVNWVILLYGGLGGFGFGLMYLPAIVMVGFYFESKRALATGIAVCGSGIGAFVFAPLCEYLLSIYSWKGATLIVAGLVLNGVVMGALYRPLEGPKPKKIPRERNLSWESDDGAILLSPQQENTPIDVSSPEALLHAKMKDNINRELAHKDPIVKKKQSDVECVRSCHDLSQPAGKQYKVATISKSAMDLTYCDATERKEAERRAKDLERPMYRQDIFYSGSVQNLPEYKQSKQDMAEYVKSTTSIPVIQEEEELGGKKSCIWECRRWFKACTDVFTTMMDFSLLKNPVFTPYGISCFLCMTGFFVPFTFLPDHALAQGCTKNQSAFLISLIGVANTLARVLCGWVSDQSWADPILINNSALIIGGIATILCPFCYNYGLLVTYSLVFGACIAAFVSLRSIIMVELMGLEKLTNAFGLVTMCQGLSAFIGAPIAGALYDATGDYTYSFYMAGGTLFAAGVICIPLRRISVWYNNKQQRLLNTSADTTREVGYNDEKVTLTQNQHKLEKGEKPRPSAVEL